MNHSIFRLLLLCIPLFLYACDVDQTQEGEMPEVDVDVEEGQMPAYDVEWADVDVGTRTQTITVPEVEVNQVEKQVEVPYIDIGMPQGYEGERGERTLQVEAETMHAESNLDIRRIYAAGDELIVIAELNVAGEQLQDQVMRVSDQVVVNAPDMPVRYYIIGDRPQRGFNNAYTYLRSQDDISARLQNARLLFEES